LGSMQLFNTSEASGLELVINMRPPANARLSQ
jgi:hypothetical protein